VLKIPLIIGLPILLVLLVIALVMENVLEMVRVRATLDGKEIIVMKLDLLNISSVDINALLTKVFADSNLSKMDSKESMDVPVILAGLDSLALYLFVLTAVIIMESVLLIILVNVLMDLEEILVKLTADAKAKESVLQIPMFAYVKKAISKNHYNTIRIKKEKKFKIIYCKINKILKNYYLNF
jgi:hypothetical protein